MATNALARFLTLHRLIALCVTTGLTVTAVDIHRYHIPRHPQTSHIVASRFDSQRGYCSNGSWVFPAGYLVTLVYIEEIDADADDVRNWFAASAWYTLTLRGAQSFVPRIPARSTYTLWPNIDLEPDATVGDLGRDNRAIVQNRYRLHLCPPALLLPD